MMRFERVAEPAHFEARARTPGNAWLADHPTNGRPPSRYWKPFLDDLRRGFRELCAYSATLTPVGSVDHFVSIDETGVARFATDRIPPPKRAQAEYMLKQLGLRHDERFIRQRRSWYEKYQSGLITLEALHTFAPLIAEAARKQIESTKEAR